MEWRCINFTAVVDDSKDDVLSMYEFYKKYGGWLKSVSLSLPSLDISAPTVEYDICESIITHDGEYVYLTLLLNNDDETISIDMDNTFVEIFDMEHNFERGYIPAYVYSKHKGNECFEIAEIKIDTIKSKFKL